MGNFTIYLRRNKANGKCYVGQTKNFNKRENDWYCLKSKYANSIIDEDRMKYGLDNWTVETLATSDNQEDAWELEQRFINDFNTKWPNGYNLSDGGCSGNKGVHPSDETIQKISKSNLNNEKQSKLVYQYTIDGKLIKVWPSTRECERNGFNHGNISMCCNGKQKTHMGYKWSNIPL